MAQSQRSGRCIKSDSRKRLLLGDAVEHLDAQHAPGGLGVDQLAHRAGRAGFGDVPPELQPPLPADVIAHQRADQAGADQPAHRVGGDDRAGDAQPEPHHAQHGAGAGIGVDGLGEAEDELLLPEEHGAEELETALAAPEGAANSYYFVRARRAGPRSDVYAAARVGDLERVRCAATQSIARRTVMIVQQRVLMTSGVRCHTLLPVRSATAHPSSCFMSLLFHRCLERAPKWLGKSGSLACAKWHSLSAK